MGCGTSVAPPQSQPAKYVLTEMKSTCLVFGMPDSGQDIFIKSITNCFTGLGGPNRIPFSFIQVPSNREDRLNWVSQFQNHPRVIMSFFFVNVKSESQMLVSLKTLNWFRSQIQDIASIYPVAYAKTASEIAIFMKLKELLGNSIEISTFNEENPSDIRIYAEHITSCLAKNHNIKSSL